MGPPAEPPVLQYAFCKSDGREPIDLWSLTALGFLLALLECAQPDLARIGRLALLTGVAILLRAAWRACRHCLRFASRRAPRVVRLRPDGG